MMKKLLVFMTIALLVSSCRQGSSYDGMAVLADRYGEEELISSEVIIIKNNEITLDPVNFSEGVYYISADTVAIQSLAEGFPIYVDATQGGNIKIRNDEVVIGGNSENEAYQRLRSELSQLDKEDLPAQLSLWDNYFSEHLLHPLGEEVFLNDFDAENMFVLAPEHVALFLEYANEPFLFRPSIIELRAWMESLNSKQQTVIIKQ